MRVLWYVISNVSPFVLIAFGAVCGLALRALIVWAWEAVVDIRDYESVSAVDHDIGEGGSGDSRIYVAETPGFQRIRKALTRTK